VGRNETKKLRSKIWGETSRKRGKGKRTRIMLRKRIKGNECEREGRPKRLSEVFKKYKIALAALKLTLPDERRKAKRGQC